MSAASVTTSLVSSIFSAPSAIASLKASIAQRTADFYKLSSTINSQATQLRQYESIRSASMTPGERAKLATAQQAIVEARNTFTSTNNDLSSVTATLAKASPSAAEYSSLLVDVPRVIAGMAATKQLVDGAGQLTTSLINGLTPAERQQLGAGAVAGISIGAVLVIGGLAWWFIFRRRR